MTTALSQAWPMSWQRCLMDFLGSIYEKSHAQGSRDNYQGILLHFFADAGKHPENVTRQDVEAFLRRRYRGTGPISTATRNNRIAVLTSFYDYAASYTVASPQGPQPLLSRPSPLAGFHAGRAARRYRALSEEEITRLFSVIPTDTTVGLRDRALYLTYFLTTRRRSEILRLRWGDIERGMIRDDQGRIQEGYLYHFRGKGHSQEDDVAELPLVAYMAIERYLIASGRLSSIAADDPVFAAIGLPHGKGKMPSSDMPVSGRTVLQMLKKYATKAGLDTRRVCIHSFRHASVQQRLKAGQQPLAIMAITRHKSLDVFLRYAMGLSATADPGAKLLEAKFAHLSMP